jgi:hypothetical protein
MVTFVYPTACATEPTKHRDWPVLNPFVPVRPDRQPKDLTLNLAAVKLEPFFGRSIFDRVDITFCLVFV